MDALVNDLNNCQWDLDVRIQIRLRRLIADDPRTENFLLITELPDSPLSMSR